MGKREEKYSPIFLQCCNSGAHGVGSKRIIIKECEVRLVMNSAVTFCEYILKIYKNHKDKK